MMATFSGSTISFLLLSALVSTFFLLCLSPLNQTIKIATRVSSMYSPNYSIEEKKPSQDFERFLTGSRLHHHLHRRHFHCHFTTALQILAAPSNFPVIASREKKTTGFERIEGGLAKARTAISRAIRSRSSSSFKEGSFIPRGSMYRNHYAFHQF
ncbi:hypothetical protein OIU77_005673 [Salix suchowensis]|uniref:Uncharacterized protein n=1 Tax=Salix suchowensis TaxID=1278906 RepID=A0ABQ9AQA2_9ROSI|nr:hypothetical protein OIU77_005673 [Salix suchowensis]